MDSPTPPTKTEQTISLYAAHKKVYPRAVSGIFNNWRWIGVLVTQLVFYGFCWLPWNGRQAVLFDLVERKFYIFGMIFWPQDVFWLAVLLIISAFSLFLFTAVAGRLWCGYSCPQTVYTEMFMWIERKLEGDRNARIKMDKADWTAAKITRRALKYFCWGALSLWTGFTLVGYFTPIKTLGLEVLHWQLGPWETFWMFFYAGFAYLMAGHLREQVCTYMCPYARFQGVMFDPDTLVITYDVERGEPRGARSKNQNTTESAKGDCVDCGLCVAVCPTGIDIREGLQYECIGCAACIDACDQVMDKMHYPRGLIRYSTEHAIAEHWGWKEILAHVVRPRVLVYSAVLWVVIGAFVWGIATKPELRVDVMRDRNALAREVEGEMIENVYRLQVMNVSESAQQYTVSVEGLPEATLDGVTQIALPAAGIREFTVAVRVPAEVGVKGANKIYFNVQSQTDKSIAVHEKTTFIQPE